MRELMKDFLNKCSKAYYSGNPLISDEEFDSLADRYNYSEIGHLISNGIPHLYKMYSLQKVFEKEEIRELMREQGPMSYIKTPKLDGAAVSIIYIKGILALGLTRGDGNIGRDITDKVACLVPNTISLDGEIQITGEVICPSDNANARNLAAGSLNLKDLEEFKTRPLKFCAYDIQGTDFKTWVEAMNFIDSEGFNVITKFCADRYPTDGEVYRLNDIKKYKNLGYTSHHPRGSFAYKEPKDGVETILKDVIWQVGRSGVVSPVGIFDPVTVGEAVVSKATLHNIEYIRMLDLEIGCTIEVIRAGEIIPRIVRRIDL